MLKVRCVLNINLYPLDYRIKLIAEDIKGTNFPNSTLILGEEKNSKLESALESFRILCCEGDLSWTCQCKSCSSIKNLDSEYLVITGKKESFKNVEAFCKNFSKNPNDTTRFLLERELKKILKRMIFPRSLKKEKNLDEIFDFINYKMSGNISIKDVEKLLLGNEDKRKLMQESYSLGVDALKEIINFAVSADQGKKKVIIIEHIEDLNESVLNLLLKILEEPPKNTYFILTSENKNKVKKTVLSRLRVYYLEKLKKSEELEIVKKVFLSDKKDFADFFKRDVDKQTIEIADRLFNLIYGNGNKSNLDTAFKIPEEDYKIEREDVKVFLKRLLENFENELLKESLSIIDLDRINFMKNVIKQEYKNFNIYNTSVSGIIENLIFESDSFY